MPASWVTSGLLQWLGHAAPNFGVAVLLANSIHLVERRGKNLQIDPHRQVEISTLLESIPEAAVIVDKDGRIVEANSAAASLTGTTTREEMRGMSAEEISRALQNEEPKGLKSIVERVFAGKAIRHERRILRNRKSGVTSELLVSANPIQDEEGNPIAALLIARDVTELAQLQRRSGDMERHRAIGQMAAALAHDFNNILDTIGQASAVLELNMDRPASERKPLLDVIQNTVRRGAEMVQSIREYLRTGQGALQPVDLCSVMHEALELTRPLWQKANIKVKTSLSPVPSVNANAADLRRVFTNLIINAIDAMPQGGEVTLTCESSERQVIAMVADTGVGIPPADQKQVFYPYFTTKPQGTGLGLSGAQKIVLSYGGNISFQSEPGKGTTFTITLPASNGKTKAA